MSEFNSIFAQLRQTRQNAVNESVVEEPKDLALNEGVVEEPVKPEVQEPVVEEVNEEVSAVFCADCGALVSGFMNESEVEECPCCGSEELLEKVVKVVRDGKIVTKKKKTGPKKRISAAQKAALAKARKKAHTAAANKQRAKSMAKGAKAGLHEEDIIVCPECGYEGAEEDFAFDDNDNLTCPECGAIVIDEACGKQNESVDDNKVMADLLESVNAPQFVKDALNEGKTSFVAGYLELKMGK